MGRVGDETSSQEEADYTIKAIAYRPNDEQDAISALVFDRLRNAVNTASGGP